MVINLHAEGGNYFHYT